MGSDTDRKADDNRLNNFASIRCVCGRQIRLDEPCIFRIRESVPLVVLGRSIARAEHEAIDVEILAELTTNHH